jgi:hypothetical protein
MGINNNGRSIANILRPFGAGCWLVMEPCALRVVGL